MLKIYEAINGSFDEKITKKCAKLKILSKLKSSYLIYVVKLFQILKILYSANEEK